MFPSALTFLALSLLTSTQALPTAQDASGAFSLMALRSASPIHFQAVVANGGTFWIGKNTSTYCPSPPVDAKTCAATTQNVTALVCSDSSDASSSCGMNDLVPGGQQVFVDPKDGTIGYTQAHSAEMPQGAYTDIFNVTDGYLGTSKGGLVACPDGEGHYTVKVALDSCEVTDCLGFAAKMLNTSAQAWEYA